MTSELGQGAFLPFYLANHLDNIWLGSEWPTSVVLFLFFGFNFIRKLCAFCFARNIPVLGVETPAMSAPESLLTFKINVKGILAKKKIL